MVFKSKKIAKIYLHYVCTREELGERIEEMEKMFDKHNGVDIAKPKKLITFPLIPPIPNSLICQKTETI